MDPHLLGRLDGRGKAHARDREADVDRGPHAGVEEVGLQEDLPVGNRDDIGRDVRRNVARLRLDDRQRGQASAALLVGELRSALQKARVQIEDIAGIGLATGRTAQQQRDLAIAYRMLGEVVIDHQRMAFRVAEVLAHGARRERSEVLHRRRLGRGGRDDDGVRHRAVLLQRFDDLRHRRALLPDGAVDADQVLARGVDDGVQRDGRFASLSVADQQLALAAPDGNHGVDGLDAGVHRLAHALSVDDARRQPLHRQRVCGDDLPPVVDRFAQRIHHAPDHSLAHRHGHDGACALDFVALFDLGVVAQQHGAHLGLVQVHGQSGHAVGELDQLARHHFVQAMHARNAVAQRDHRADLIHLDALLVVLNLLAEQRGYLVRVDLCHVFPALDPILNPNSNSVFLNPESMRSPASV